MRHAGRTSDLCVCHRNQSSAPGVLREASQGRGLLGLYDLFAGGAFSRATVFALGIMPYISASIVVQLMGIAIPYLQKLQKSHRDKVFEIHRDNY